MKSHTILLYGATGFSGRLIAAEARDTGMGADDDRSPDRMLLAGRDNTALAALGQELGMPHRAFGLQDPAAVARGLTDVDVVLNAAGPFALTGDHLSKAALTSRCHYVDINGEVDVYKKLDDLGIYAVQRGCAMVSGAGHTAAASDLLLHVALQKLEAAGILELGAVRLAHSRVTTLSRGSLETLERSLREQVTVVRLTETAAEGGGMRKAQVLWHEPVGRFERSFDFRFSTVQREKNRSDVNIASAANLIDTFTARLTLARKGFLVHRIESYVEAGTLGRIAYQLGTFLAPFAALPWTRDLLRVQLDMLPAGPSRQEMDNSPATVVLEIEDPFHRRVIDWRLHTPNPYRFTARAAVEVSKRVANSKMTGWLTPSQVLLPERESLNGEKDQYLRGCRLDDLVTVQPEGH